MVVRVRLLILDEDRNPEAEDVIGEHELLREMQIELLDELHIKGVKGIKKAYLDKQTKFIWESDDRGFEQVTQT